MSLGRLLVVYWSLSPLQSLGGLSWLSWCREGVIVVRSLAGVSPVAWWYPGRSSSGDFVVLVVSWCSVMRYRYRYSYTYASMHTYGI